MQTTKASFRSLIVWQKSIELVKLIYGLSDQLPGKEQYALSSQMIRASISIPSNIAEGWSRHRKTEFIRYLEIAFASSCELETQIIIVNEIYPRVNCTQAQELLLEVQKMLTTFTKKIKTS
jgi:four helix bundle protein